MLRIAAASRQLSPTTATTLRRGGGAAVAADWLIGSTGMLFLKTSIAAAEREQPGGVGSCRSCLATAAAVIVDSETMTLCACLSAHVSVEIIVCQINVTTLSLQRL